MIFFVYLRVLKSVKATIKYILQQTLGFRRYLYVFALFKIKTLRFDKKEADFFHFLKFIADGKGSVLDLGANLGIMSYHLAQKAPNSTIHAVEPIPANFEVLKKIKTRYALTNLVLHELSLGAEKGMVNMVLPEQGKVKMQGLSHVKHKSIPELNEGQEFEVPMEKLDNLFKGEQIQAIKLDVENFEYFVLQGGQGLLTEQHPIVYVELWENENRAHCFRLLQSLAYQAYVVVDNSLTLFDSTKHKHQNFIFKLGSVSE